MTTRPTPEVPDASLLPPEDGWRRVLHDEIHARPSAHIRLPALLVYLAVYNDEVTRLQECEHLRRLPGQEGLTLDDLRNQFFRFQLPGYTLKWERHTEFTRYSLVQAFDGDLARIGTDRALLETLLLPTGWLAGVPGRTVCAIQMAMVPGDLAQPADVVSRVRPWLGDAPVMASLMGNQAHSLVVTDFRLRDSGFERMVVVAPSDTSETRAGRISQRLLEMETYRLMALRGLPVAKGLSPELASAESGLANITQHMEGERVSDQAMLDQLVRLAAQVEKAIAQHQYRFSATRAYDRLVAQRIAELRERPISGIQTVGEFMQRRLSPAMATVASTSERLASLSERVSRASALLRTRVDIATEGQNQQLLEKLTRGQAMQLRLQSTVEGLSIAAISYYVVSLMLYAAKALKSAGVPIQPEIAVGALIPVVLWAVWKTTRRIHATLRGEP